jgi:hypothetical protein
MGLTLALSAFALFILKLYLIALTAQIIPASLIWLTQGSTIAVAGTTAAPFLCFGKWGQQNGVAQRMEDFVEVVEKLPAP